jgi:hypothetical protein
MPRRHGRSYLVPDPQGKQFVLHCPKKNPDRPDGLWPCSELSGLIIHAINQHTGDPCRKRKYWSRREVIPRMERHAPRKKSKKQGAKE